MNNHLSASMRRITMLEQELVVMKQMQVEYNLLLNYLVEYHPTNQDADTEYTQTNVPNEFEIYTDKLKKLEVRGIKTEISKSGDRMTVTRLPKQPK